MTSSRTMCIVLTSLIAALAVGCRAFDNDSPGVRRNAGDSGGDTVGGDADSGGGLTIYDIQDVTRPDHPAVDSVVQIEGVIVSGLDATSASLNFWVIEPDGGDYSGVYVYDADGVTPGDLEIGDVVSLTATVAEYQGLTELSLRGDTAEVTVTGSGQAVPVEMVSAADLGTIATGGARAEALEGVLVAIDGTVTVDNANLGFGEWSVTNGTASLRVDDLAWDDAEVGRAPEQEITLLRGLMHFSFDDVKIEPRDENDVQAPAVEGEVHTIYEIQDVDNASHPGENTVVEIRDVVVTAVSLTDTAAVDGFFVSEPGGGDYSGVYVYDAGGVSPAGLQVGDQVTLVGQYTEYYGLTEIRLTASVSVVTVSSPDNTVPFEAIAAADLGTINTTGARAEALEGVLVEITGELTVDSLNPDDPNGDFGEYSVTNGTDSLRVDDAIFNSRTDLVLGQGITLLRGPLTYAFQEFKIEPRGASDVSSSPPPYSIYQIQDRNSALPAPEASPVRVENVVVTAVEDATGPFFVQVQEADQLAGYGAAFSGIYCNRAADAANPSVAVGDLVTLEGTYEEIPATLRNANSQIAVDLVEIVAAGGGAVPAPELVAASDIATGAFYAEWWEGVLVRVEDVSVTDPDLGSGEFEVDGALRVDDLLYPGAQTEGAAALAGFEFLIGPLYFSYGDHKLVPRDTNDMQAWPVTIPPVTVYQMQDRSHPEFVAVNEYIRVENVIVTAVVPSGADESDFFIQIADADQDGTYGAAYSGIYVDRSAGATPAVTIGDVVNIEGTFSGDGLGSRISAATVAVVSSGATVPAATVVDPATVATGGADADTYEGVLLRVETVSLTAPNPDGSSDYGEFAVTGGLRVDDLIYGNAENDGRFATAGFNALTGVLNYAYGNVKLVPRDAADIDATAFSVTVVSIYDIQTGNLAVYDPLSIEDVVVTAVRGDGSGDFVVQVAEADYDGTYGSQYSGIYVGRDLDSTPVVAVGDVVHVEGVYVEWYSNSQIGPTTVQVASAGGGAVPAPTVVQPADVATSGSDGELYEGVLVQVQNVSVTNASLSYGEFELTGTLRGDDQLYADAQVDAAANFNAGAGFQSITGVLYFSFSDFKIEPRDAADMVSN